jgi:hypothetical protein
MADARGIQRAEKNLKAPAENRDSANQLGIVSIQSRDKVCVSKCNFYIIKRKDFEKWFHMIVSRG